MKTAATIRIRPNASPNRRWVSANDRDTGLARSNTATLSARHSAYAK